MTYRYLPYCWPLWISAFITLSLGIFILIKRRNAKGAVSFILSMLILTVWSSGNALEMLGADFATKLFWANVQYFAYCYSPVTLLALCMEYTGFRSWMKSGKILYLCILPTLVFLLVWTDGSHGFIRQNMQLSYGGLFPVLAKDYGPVFYVHAAYSYLLNFSAWALLFNAAFFRHSVYRKQAFSLLAGLSLILLSNLLYIFHLIPSYRFDVTPVFFGLAGLMAAWGLFRYRLFDIVPVAWARVLQIMETGIMIVDLRGRLLDVNPAFEKLAGVEAAKIMAKPVSEACKSIPGLSEACMDPNEARAEFSVCAGDGKKIYEALFSPLSSSAGIPMARMVMIHEITDRKLAQELLLKQQWQLAVSEEREKMARDLHDNLGQVLGFVNLQAQGIRQELKNSGVDSVTGRIDRLVDATQSAHADLRKYIRSIRDPAYSEADFLTALRKNVFEFRDRTGIGVKLSIPDGFSGETMQPNAQIQILSVVKEALNNIRKHAEAEHAEIAVSLERETICVSIRDDGIGFFEECHPDRSKTKFGLDIMRERVAEIGGTLKVESVPGKGCVIILNAPMKKGDTGNETDACG